MVPLIFTHDASNSFLETTTFLVESQKQKSSGIPCIVCGNYGLGDPWVPRGMSMITTHSHVGALFSKPSDCGDWQPRPGKERRRRRVMLWGNLPFSPNSKMPTSSTKWLWLSSIPIENWAKGNMQQPWIHCGCKTPPQGPKYIQNQLRHWNSWLDHTSRGFSSMHVLMLGLLGLFNHLASKNIAKTTF